VEAPVAIARDDEQQRSLAELLLDDRSDDDVDLGFRRHVFCLLHGGKVLTTCLQLVDCLSNPPPNKPFRLFGVPARTWSASAANSGSASPRCWISRATGIWRRRMSSIVERAGLQQGGWTGRRDPSRIGCQLDAFAVGDAVHPVRGSIESHPPFSYGRRLCVVLETSERLGTGHAGGTNELGVGLLRTADEQRYVRRHGGEAAFPDGREHRAVGVDQPGRRPLAGKPSPVFRLLDRQIAQPPTGRGRSRAADLIGSQCFWAGERDDPGV
jgi:hypothetical protein